MLPPNFSPPRSRLLVFVIATFLLLAAWGPFESRLLVNATELQDSSDIDTADQTVVHIPLDALVQSQDERSGIERDEGYAPDFDYFDRSLLGRQEPQPPQVSELKNNEKRNMEISPGETAYFVFKRGKRTARANGDALEALEARGTGNTSDDLDEGDFTRDTDELDVDVDGAGNTILVRQTKNRVWISANTCRQPTANGTAKPKAYPQLVMFISTSTKNQKPGLDSIDDTVTPPTGLLFENGFASFNLSADNDIYVGVSAPVLPKDLVGSWSFEVAASVDGSYHNYNGTNPFLYMVDNDSASALFITYNLTEPDAPNNTEDWIKNNPFKMYAFQSGSDAPITGMEHSLCALKDLNKTTNVSVAVTITTKFGANLPKSQFHVQGLQPGKRYNGFLTVEGGKDVLELPGNGTIRGGGMVFQPFDYTTKSDDSCQVIFDLDFCSSVAYAVPSNSSFAGKDAELRALYDKVTLDYYKNFTNSLAQVACDTAGEAQYSLARTCQNCADDYKNWLCSVLIPRCEDWSAPGAWLQERNVNMPFADGSLTFGGNVSSEMNETRRMRLGYNSTRNPGIDPVVPNRPYKEMMPCEDLCFDIVRSCPPQLQFSCPNSPARELTYGKRDPGEVELRCNFPGAVVKLNVQGVVGVVRPGVWSVMLVVVVAAASLWL